MDRRNFLRGLAGCFAATAAPGVIGSGVLMPVRKIATPGRTIRFRRWVPWAHGIVYEDEPFYAPLCEQLERTPYDVMRNGSSRAQIERIRRELLKHAQPMQHFRTFVLHNYGGNVLGLA